MAKAQKGDLIRITQKIDGCNDIYEIGDILEVNSRRNDYDVYANYLGEEVTIADIEYEIHRKAGEEDAVETPQSRPDSAHYHEGSVDVWKFADENFSTEEVTGFHRINAIKYLTRYGKKGGSNRKDLEKAIVSIEKLLTIHHSE